jgi:hypothetical protein
MFLIADEGRVADHAVVKRLWCNVKEVTDTNVRFNAGFRKEHLREAGRRLKQFNA